MIAKEEFWQLTGDLDDTENEFRLFSLIATPSLLSFRLAQCL